MSKLTFLLLALFFVVPTVAFAQEPILINEPVVVEEPTGVNSYELFWPLVAGKTKDDSLYSLKRLKENIRGWLIFGKPQKAEHQTRLTEKRLLEAEVLMMNDKTELAKETLNDAHETLSLALSIWNQADENAPTKALVDEINNMLNNLNEFIPFLNGKYDGYSNELDQVTSVITDFRGQI